MPSRVMTPTELGLLHRNKTEYKIKEEFVKAWLMNYIDTIRPSAQRYATITAPFGDTDEPDYNKVAEYVRQTANLNNSRHFDLDRVLKEIDTAIQKRRDNMQMSGTWNDKNGHRKWYNTLTNIQHELGEAERKINTERRRQMWRRMSAPANCGVRRIDPALQVIRPAPIAVAIESESDESEEEDDEEEAERRAAKKKKESQRKKKQEKKKKQARRQAEEEALEEERQRAKLEIIVRQMNQDHMEKVNRLLLWVKGLVVVVCIAVVVMYYH